MKTIILLLLTISLFYSCGDDVHEESSKDVLITIKSDYSTDLNPNQEIPDAKSVVYVYYDVDPSDMISSVYHYEGKGRFVSKTKVIEPLQIDTINATGTVVIKPKYIDRSVTIAFESNYYKGRFSILHSYLDLKESVSLTMINNP